MYLFQSFVNFLGYIVDQMDDDFLDHADDRTEGSQSDCRSYPIDW